MAKAIPQFALGRNSNVFITPLTVSDVGVFSVAAGPYSLFGHLDSDALDSSLSTVNVAPTGALNSNPVSQERSTSFSITEIASAFPVVGTAQNYPGWSATGNVLLKCWASATYFRVTVTSYGNADDITTGDPTCQIDAYCVMTRFGKASPKAKGTYTATFSTIAYVDPATGSYINNPAITIY